MLLFQETLCGEGVHTCACADIHMFMCEGLHTFMWKPHVEVWCFSQLFPPYFLRRASPIGLAACLSRELCLPEQHGVFIWVPGTQTQAIHPLSHLHSPTLVAFICVSCALEVCSDWIRDIQSLVQEAWPLSGVHNFSWKQTKFQCLQ